MTSTPQKFLASLVNTIQVAAAEGPLVHSGAELLSGHSGGGVLGLLQRLPSLFEGTEASYLEIGVFQGLTLLSVAAANPDVQCYGIDNFAFFDPNGRNRGVVLERAERLRLHNAHLIDADYEDALESLAERADPKRIGVYFIDGPHDYRSQLMCLALVKPYLHPRAVIVVDDSNYAHVRQANRDFLRTHPEFRLLFEAYTRAHPGTLSEQERESVRKGWWNGVNVIVRDPDSELPYAEPPTCRDRTLFENDHLVHAARLAEFAPQAVRAMDALFSGRIPEAGVLLGRAWRDSRRESRMLQGRVKTRNTYSSGIEGEHWNESVGDGVNGVQVQSG